MASAGQLSAGHARAILKLSTEKQQIIAAQIIVDKALSVRQAETLAARMANEKQNKKVNEKSEVIVDYMSEIEKNLSETLGRRVNIVSGKKKGRLEIEYYGGEDLETLISAISRIKI